MEQSPLRDLCREAVNKHNDPQAAIKWALAKVEQDQDLLDELLQPIIAAAIRGVVYDLRHEDKRDLKYPTDTQRGLASIQATSGIIAAGFLKSWLLPDGTLLADATREMLQDEAAECQARSQGEFVNATFYVALAAKTPVGKKVGQCFNDKQAESLLQNIKNGKKLAVA